MTNSWDKEVFITKLIVIIIVFLTITLIALSGLNYEKFLQFEYINLCQDIVKQAEIIKEQEVRLLNAHNVLQEVSLKLDEMTQDLTLNYSKNFIATIQKQLTLSVTYK